MALDLVSLADAKEYLRKIDSNTSTDVQVRKFISDASRVIGDRLNREIRNRKYTKYYDGKSRIHLGEFPVTEITSITPDEGTLPRTYSSSDALDTDEYLLSDPDSGILDIHVFRFGSSARAVKIVFKAGYSEFEIVENINDKLEWTDGTTNFNETLVAKNENTTYGDTYDNVYTARELATYMASVMNAATSSSADYTVTYNEQTGEFIFKKTSGTFVLKFFNGTNPERTVGRLLGFTEDSEDSNLNPVNWNQWSIDSGTVGTAATAVSLGSQAGRIKIHNMDASKNLSYNFDNGTDFYTILPGAQPDDITPTKYSTIYLKGSAASTDYQIAWTTQSSSLTWTSDYGVFGIPQDIRDACLQLVKLYWRKGGHGKETDVGVSSLSDQIGSVTFEKDEQEQILDRVEQYRIMNV